MRDDNYISSGRDIRNKRRYKQRRRQVMLNRGIFAGILLIIVLIAAIIVVKSCRGDAATTSSNNVKTTQNNNSSNNASTEDIKENDNSEDTKNTEDSSELSTEEQTTPQTSATYKTDGKRIVCVDAGHGGIDGGSASADGILEKEDNLKMAQALKKELEALGITVYMTREDDTFLEISERVKFANDKNADLLISIHRNEYAADTSVKGFETWVHSSKPADSTDVATRIQAALVQVGITRDRGVKFGSQGSSSEDYYINNHSKGPSCLLEMGFMTNVADNSIFRESTNTLAKAIAKAIVEWMEAQGL